MLITDFNDGDKIRLSHFPDDRYFQIKKVGDKIIILDEFGRIVTPNITDARSKQWYLYQGE